MNKEPVVVIAAVVEVWSPLEIRGPSEAREMVGGTRPLFVGPAEKQM